MCVWWGGAGCGCATWSWTVLSSGSPRGPRPHRMVHRVAHVRPRDTCSEHSQAIDIRIACFTTGSLRMIPPPQHTIRPAPHSLLVHNRYWPRRDQWASLAPACITPAPGSGQGHELREAGVLWVKAHVPGLESTPRTTSALFDCVEAHSLRGRFVACCLFSKNIICGGPEIAYWESIWDKGAAQLGFCEDWHICTAPLCCTHHLGAVTAPSRLVQVRASQCSGSPLTITSSRPASEGQWTDVVVVFRSRSPQDAALELYVPNWNCQMIISSVTASCLPSHCTTRHAEELALHPLSSTPYDSSYEKGACLCHVQIHGW